MPQNDLEALESWVNVGIWAETPTTLDKFWLALLCGKYGRATQWATNDQLAAMGALIRELHANAPGSATARRSGCVAGGGWPTGRG